MKKMTRTFIITAVLMVLLTGCGWQLSEVQKPLETEMSLKDQLLSLGNNATISSNKEMVALWDYLNNNEPLKDILGKPKWQIADNCYLTIVEGRGAIRLVEDDITVTLKFITTIDCPVDVKESDISFIVSKVSDTYEMGTYTDGNTTRWFLGKSEVSD